MFEICLLANNVQDTKRIFFHLCNYHQKNFMKFMNHDNNNNNTKANDDYNNHHRHEYEKKRYNERKKKQYKRISRIISQMRDK